MHACGSNTLRSSVVSTIALGPDAAAALASRGNSDSTCIMMTDQNGATITVATSIKIGPVAVTTTTAIARVTNPNLSKLGGLPEARLLVAQFCGADRGAREIRRLQEAAGAASSMRRPSESPADFRYTYCANFVE